MGYIRARMRSRPAIAVARGIRARRRLRRSTAPGRGRADRLVPPRGRRRDVPEIAVDRRELDDGGRGPQRRLEGRAQRRGDGRDRSGEGRLGHGGVRPARRRRPPVRPRAAGVGRRRGPAGRRLGRHQHLVARPPRGRRRPRRSAGRSPPSSPAPTRSSTASRPASTARRSCDGRRRRLLQGRDRRQARARARERQGRGRPRRSAGRVVSRCEQRRGRSLAGAVSAGVSWRRKPAGRPQATRRATRDAPAVTTSRAATARRRRSWMPGAARGRGADACACARSCGRLAGAARSPTRPSAAGAAR